MNYEVIENKLINQEFTVKFDYNISDVKYYNGIFVVLLEIPNDVNEVDNIYGVSQQGKLIWRIESPIKAFNISINEQGYDYLANSIYVGVFEKEGSFSANTFFGMKYTFDYKTGKLISKEARK
jgi:hypothetical protein